MAKIDITGQKFGRLRVIKEAGLNKYHSALWFCACDCGSFGVFVGSCLRSGHTKSCGCLFKELKRKKWSGGKNPNFGGLSEETRKKLSRSKKGKRPSPETVLKRAAACRGSKHWNWKGGITKKRSRAIGSMDHKKWRTAVFERDKYTCQLCEKAGIYLQAHHIEFWSACPERRLAIDNGTTLCKSCHVKLHAVLRKIKTDLIRKGELPCRSW